MGRGKSQDGQLHLEICLMPNLLNKGLGTPRYFKDFKTISGSDESLGIKICFQPDGPWSLVVL